MKRRLSKGEIRAIKIDEDSLYEFIREMMHENCALYFDLLDNKKTEQCMRWDKQNHSFTWIVYNREDRAKVDFDSVDAVLPLTTNSLFSSRRYIHFDPNELDKE